MNGLAERMVEFARSARFEDLSPEAVHQAKRRILDTLGCALGAYAAPPARVARRLALPVSGNGGARVIGCLTLTTPDMAAFANGVMIRYLDFNDSGGGHPSDNLAAVLAAAEIAHASGRDLITALAIAYELQYRLTTSIPFYDHGWDQPVPLAMASALACGRLLGLTREQSGHALALAVISNLATFQSRAGAELSMWKGCAAPNGARQAIFAALLAREGMSGPTDPIDGTYGLWAQTVGKPHEVARLRLGADTAITQTNLKCHPVRDTCQPVVDTALDLRRQIAAPEIAALAVHTYRSAYRKSVEDPEMWRPLTRETADHSMLIATVVALLDGRITPDTFERGRYRDADVLALIGRMRVEVVGEFDRDFTEHAARNCRIEATTRDGSKRTAHRRLTREDIVRGPGDGQIEAKFEELVRGVLTSGERRALIDMVWRLDGLVDINRLIDRLCI